VRASLAAGETRTVSAYTETTQRQLLALLQDAPALAQIIADQGVPESARAGLRRLADLRGAEAARIAERDRLKADLAAIEREEERLRQNIAAVPANDALHTRLVRQLDAAETRIGALGKAIDQAAAAVTAAHAALEQAVREFTLS